MSHYTISDSPPLMATIKTAQHTDGRWMWGIGLNDGDCGVAYAPFAKWGRFAVSEPAALSAAIAEMHERLSRSAGPYRGRIRAWLRTLEQPGLFEVFEQATQEAA